MTLSGYIQAWGNPMLIGCRWSIRGPLNRITEHLRFCFICVVIGLSSKVGLNVHPVGTSTLKQGLRNFLPTV